MKLGDKAEEAETQFVAASNLNPGSVWFIESEELRPADEIGTDDFPRHGDWLEVSHRGKVTYYLECPAGLAMAIVDAVDERGAQSAEGYWFIIWDVDRADDTENAPWEFDVELATADVKSQEEAVEALRDG